MVHVLPGCNALALNPLIALRPNGVAYGFAVLSAITMKNAIFWAVTPCLLAEVYRSASIFGSQKTVIFKKKHIGLNPASTMNV